VGFLKRFSRLKMAPLEKAEALEQLRVLWHGFRIAVAVSETEIPPGVDTPRDLEAVRKMLS
jgi:3-deoxy-manno-octulosonate cytidylyltransferase (CMP-KDO synthetase)